MGSKGLKMYNLVVAGNCYDGSGTPIDIYFQVFYREANSLSNKVLTTNKQLTFNTNDIDHLGYAAGLELNSPIYVDIWQGDINKINVTRSAYKRFIYTGVASIQDNIVLDENKTITTHVSYSYLYRTFNISPNVITTDIVQQVTYYVYYDINIINDTNSTANSFKLVKAINKSTTNDLVVTFTKSGTFKILCEAGINNLEVSKTSEIIIDVADNTVVSSTLQEHYLEWE